MILVILVSPRFQHWISWTIFYGLFAINLIVDAFLLAILYRQNIKRHLPWFVAYIAWEFLIAIVAPVIWFVDPKQYVTVYWWTEAMRAVLMAGAVRESFLRTFVGFTSLRWFPWLVRGLIVTVVLYSTWKSVYAPPVQSGRMTAFLIGIEFAFRWCIAAIGILSLVLMWLFQLPTRTREESVLSGASIVSAAILVAVLSRSFFGTRFTFFTQYLPDVGYFMAALLWIKTFLRPEEEFGLKELGMDAEQVAQELHRYGESARRILRKK
jgi:hypothetical protein